MTYKRKRYEILYCYGYDCTRIYSCVVESYSAARAKRKFQKAYAGKGVELLSIRVL